MPKMGNAKNTGTSQEQDIGRQLFSLPTQAELTSKASELRAYPASHIPEVHVTEVPTAVQAIQCAPQPNSHRLVKNYTGSR